MDKKVCIIGAGGHAKVVIEIAEMLGYEIEAIYDQNADVKNVLNYPVSHHFENLKFQKNVILALGSNQNRKLNYELFSTAQFSLIHPSVVLSRSVEVGFGTVMMAGAIVNSSTKIGKHCIVNTSASIDHDCVIEDFVHISPKAALAGNVTVRQGAQVGIGACVKQNVTIGRWAVIGAGAVVIKDVPDNAIMVGNPAKYLKNNIL